MSRAHSAAAAMCAAVTLLLVITGVGLAVAVRGHSAATRSQSSAAAYDAPRAQALSAPAPATGTASDRAAPTVPSRTSAVTSAAMPPQPAPADRVGAAAAWPRHVLAGYWQDFVNQAAPLRLASVPSGYNLVDVAFAAADAAHDGGVTFKLSPALASALGGYTTAQFIADVATLHARGQRVLISVNSADGAISIDSPSAATHFAESVGALMRVYGFDGVDVDFENGLNVAYTAQALRELVALRPGAMVTLAPQTTDMQSAAGAYFQLALSIKSILTISFTQYYNSGTMLGCDGSVYAQGTEDFIAALACTQLRGGLKPSQVGLGAPASASAAKHGYIATTVVDTALSCLATRTACGRFAPPATWPDIGGVMTWSINWDAANGYTFLRTVGPFLATLP